MVLFGFTPLLLIFRSLAEFWHWFVANVPGNSVGEGQEIFQLLHPLVLPEGNGGHRSVRTIPIRSQNFVIIYTLLDRYTHVCA